MKKDLCIFQKRLKRQEFALNPKEAGSFDPISQPGGGGGGRIRPPSDLGRGATKNSVEADDRRVGDHHAALISLTVVVQAWFLYQSNHCLLLTQ